MSRPHSLGHWSEPSGSSAAVVIKELRLVLSSGVLVVAESGARAAVITLVPGAGYQLTTNLNLPSDLPIVQIGANRIRIG